MGALFEESLYPVEARLKGILKNDHHSSLKRRHSFTSESFVTDYACVPGRVDDLHISDAPVKFEEDADATKKETLK